ncbi:hypothetical protein [Nocardia sp. NPDC050406]|uniref:hypothetical protein n=1 Tax=Nocardia sp. NPDC050406 TaxID=3364318 RepID=UPI00379EC5A1
MSIDTKEPDTRDSETTAPERPSTRRSISVDVRTVAFATVVAVLAVAVVALSWMLISARQDLSVRDEAAAADRHAEQVATEYAVGSATVKFDDITGWVARLKTNAAPALATKFDATAPKLEEILVPLQWNSTATPIGSTVVSRSDDVYKVNVFVDVNSTNSQNPNGARTTVTYTVTVDANSDWQVTDVGGSDGALPLK